MGVSDSSTRHVLGRDPYSLYFHHVRGEGFPEGQGQVWEESRPTGRSKVLPFSVRAGIMPRE